MLTNMLHFVRLVYRIKVATDLFDAASCRSNDIFVCRKVFDEEVFSRCSIDLISAVGHGLPAAGLIERAPPVEAESLQELQSSYPDFWIDYVDVAGDKETDARVSAN